MNNNREKAKYGVRSVYGGVFVKGEMKGREDKVILKGGVMFSAGVRFSVKALRTSRRAESERGLTCHRGLQWAGASPTHYPIEALERLFHPGIVHTL